MQSESESHHHQDSWVSVTVTKRGGSIPRQPQLTKKSRSLGLKARQTEVVKRIAGRISSALDVSIKSGH